MKKLFIVLLGTFCSFSLLNSQSYNSWLNYSFSQRVTDINVVGDYVWISTQGGLVRYNKLNSEKTYYNRANSNLPDNNLLSVFCDTSEAVWLGSKYYGVGKFDDAICSTYNQSNSGLPFDQYNSKIKVDKNGFVWIASFQWIAKYDGNNWKTWKTGSDFSSFPIISDFIIDNKGVVWVCSTDGLGKIENDTYQIISSITAGVEVCISIDNDKNIWIGSDLHGIFLYNGDTSFTNYNISNSCLPTNNIYSISFDSKNKMWLATSEGLVKFNISDCQVYTPSASEKALLTIQTDQNGTIWCGTFNGNLLSFNGTDFTSIDLSNSPLKDNYISYIFVDNDNNKWIGSSKNTIKKTNDQFLSIFNKQTTAFAQDKNGSIWLSFGSGDTALLKTSTVNSTIFDSVNSPFNTKNVTINSLVVDNNNTLWIATQNKGLFKYDGITFTNFNTSNSAIPSNEINQLAFDVDNNLWGGSANGLFKMAGENIAIWDTVNSNIPTNIVVGLAFDSENKLWFSCMDENRIIGGDFGGGLTCFDGQTMQTYKTNNSGLLTNTIFDVYSDSSGLVWLATCGGGLMSFNKTDKWYSYNVTNSGIANNIVQRISRDKSGYFWLGHLDAGISVFNPDSFLLSVKKTDNCNSLFMIYPNPVRDELNVKLNTNVEKNIFAQIFDINGRLICSFPNQKINQQNPTIQFMLQNLLHNNQFYILRLLYDSEQLNKKFLFNNAN